MSKEVKLNEKDLVKICQNLLESKDVQKQIVKEVRRRSDKAAQQKQRKLDESIINYLKAYLG